MSKENVLRAQAKLRATVQYRYDAAFPNDRLPKMYWQTDNDEQLAALMEQAIKAGKPLTAKDLLDAQGLEADPDAVV